MAEMWAPMWTAILRKLIFIAMLLVTWLFFDRVMLRGFDTARVIQHDPKAIAHLLAGLAIAVALA